MRKHFIISSSIALAAMFAASGALAVDKASAAGKLATLSTSAVVAKASVANAAGSGDVDAIAEAVKRSDAVDAATADGQEAYSAIERALDSGDEVAAESASDALDSAVITASNALAGNFSKESPKKPANQAVKVVGGPGATDDIPNIYAKPSQTAVQASVVQSTYGNFMATSQFGTRTGFGDREITPE